MFSVLINNLLTLRKMSCLTLQEVTNHRRALLTIACLLYGDDKYFRIASLCRSTRYAVQAKISALQVPLGSPSRPGEYGHASPFNGLYGPLVACYVYEKYMKYRCSSGYQIISHPYQFSGCAWGKRRSQGIDVVFNSPNKGEDLKFVGFWPISWLVKL